MKELTLWVIVLESIFNIHPRSLVLRTSGVKSWMKKRKKTFKRGGFPTFGPAQQAVSGICGHVLKKMWTSMLNRNHDMDPNTAEIIAAGLTATLMPRIIKGFISQLCPSLVY